jgi:hypothetical protein
VIDLPPTLHDQVYQMRERTLSITITQIRRRQSYEFETVGRLAIVYSEVGVRFYRDPR